MTKRYPDLHEHLEALKRAGLLITVERPINKDTEMHPLVRWQFRGGIREEDRRAVLFTNVTDSKGRAYDIPVLGCGLARSRAIYSLRLQGSRELFGGDEQLELAEPPQGGRIEVIAECRSAHERDLYLLSCRCREEALQGKPRALVVVALFPGSRLERRRERGREFDSGLSQVAEEECQHSVLLERG